MTNIEAEMISQVVMFPIIFLFFGWVIKIIWDQKRNKLVSSLQHKVLDKFDSGEELGKFLQSTSGGNFLDRLNIQTVIPKGKLLDAVSKGIIFASLGIAAIILAFIYGDDTRFFYTTGIIIFSLSVGFIASALVSIKLSKKWGILENDNNDIVDSDTV
ncbi:MAG: hypothetical protein GY757_42850 [bacterium]|nr:hypothetical protein [bacterium]